MSAAANPARGEAALDLAGVTHRLRPTFAALVAAEAELGPLLALVERAGAGALTLAEMVALFWHCLDRPGDDLAREAFADAVIAAGIATVTPALRTLLRQILAGQ